MRTRERLTPRRIPRTFKGHQEEVDRITWAVRKVLDPLCECAEAERVDKAEVVFHYLFEDLDGLCIPLMEEYSGAAYLGYGCNRIVFRIANEWVVKVSFENDCCLPTISECDRWRHASAKEARHLLPILAAHPKGLWSVMPYASEVGTYVGKIPAHYRDGYGDPLNPHNWGLWRGRWVLLDYAR